MKRNLLIVALLLGAITTHAQYILGGKIEYERKTNVHAQFEGEEWFERYKSKMPKFSSLYYDLLFDTAQTLYKPGREVEGATKSWGDGPANENIVYTDIRAKKVTALKAIYESKFLVQDSMRQLAWKEKNEVRTILGHQCHKAVAVFCDSVYVVAFYAEDIPASGGPEMFGGLPGMILELAVPRLHCTWTATKIEQPTLAASDFKAPEKGKKVTTKGLQESIKESFTDWGKRASSNIWWCTL